VSITRPALSNRGGKARKMLRQPPPTYPEKYPGRISSRLSSRTRLHVSGGENTEEPPNPPAPPDEYSSLHSMHGRVMVENIQGSSQRTSIREL